MKIKKSIKKKIKEILFKRRLKLNSVYNFNIFEDLLYQLVKKGKVITLLQIGANDGKRFDPVFEFVKYNSSQINGFVLEPIKDYYEDLKSNYKEYPNITPINLAIHNKLNETVIYRVGKEYESKVPEFALGIASFNEEHHKKTKIPKDYMIAEKVKCISLESLINEYKIAEIDVLVIDTEGYDYEILSNIDLEKINPSIIRFEHGLSSGTMNNEEFNLLKNRFNKYEYQLIVEVSDVTAIKTMLLNG